MNWVLIGMAGALITFGSMFLKQCGQVSNLEEQLTEMKVQQEKSNEYIKKLETISKEKAKTYQKYSAKTGSALAGDINDVLQMFKHKK